jgi:hypothetical protein
MCGTAGVRAMLSAIEKVGRNQNGKGFVAVQAADSPGSKTDVELASFASLLNQRIVILSESADYVAVGQHFFNSILRPFIRRIRLDEAWYLDTYPDVRQAIAERTVSDAGDHYERFGYFEHRLPYPIKVKEDWYLREYPDVGDAIARRIFPSGQVHFQLNGFREGRIPYPHFRFDLV